MTRLPEGLDRWFSNFRVHQNTWKAHLKHQPLGPTFGISNSECLGRVSQRHISNKSPGDADGACPRRHFENHCPRLDDNLTYGFIYQLSDIWCQTDLLQLNKWLGSKIKWNPCAHLAQIASPVVKEGSGHLPAQLQSGHRAGEGQVWRYYFFKQESLISAAWKLLQLSLWDAPGRDLKRRSK